MNHADVQRQMADYLEGDLGLDRRALFDAHLDECTECAAEITEMQDTISLLRSLPDPEVPEGFSNQVMRRIRSGEGDRSFLDMVRDGLDAIFAPKVLYPVSVAMIAAGVLLATGQVQLIEQTAPETRSGGTDLIVRLAPGTGLSGTQMPVDREQHYGAHAFSGSGAFPGNGALTGNGTEAQSLSPVRPFMEVVPIEELVVAQQQTRPPWASRSNGMGGAVPVATTPRPGLAPRSSTRMSLPATSSEQNLPSSDEWLAELQRSPAVFAGRLTRLSLAEQELWVQSLARRASEQGRLDEVIEALRRSQTAPARHLADDFAAAGQRVQTADSSGGD